MLKDILKITVQEKKKEGLDKNVIKNVLKEIIQLFILDFIYNSPYGNSLIFTGGTALRTCYGLNRLSEDIDFDLENNESIVDKEKFASDLISFFRNKLKYEDIEKTMSGKNKKIYLKFSAIYEPDIPAKSESQKLFAKIEIEKNISRHYAIEFTPVSRFNLNFIAKHYSLSTLMASKIIAILRRTFKKGKNDLITFKGRDYYDILWFLKKEINPDMERIKDVLNIDTKKELYMKLRDRITRIDTAYLNEDLRSLFEDGRFIDNYCKNYKEMIKEYLTVIKIT